MIRDMIAIRERLTIRKITMIRTMITIREMMAVNDSGQEGYQQSGEMMIESLPVGSSWQSLTT
jgi:hypothetical protein